MSLKLGRIQPWTAELAALINLKNLLLENYSKYFDDLLSGERSLPFGLLVLTNGTLTRETCLRGFRPGLSHKPGCTAMRYIAQLKYAFVFAHVLNLVP